VRTSTAARPLICAHACTVEGGSPNTLAGLRRLLETSVEMVELDVRRSGDGVLVAHHDPRLPDGRSTRELPYEEIVASYPDTARPAGVEELIRAAAGLTRLHLDVKEPDVEDEAVELALGSASTDELVVTSESAKQVARVKARHPQVTVGLSLDRSPASFLFGLARARHSRADLLSIQYLHLRTRLPGWAAAEGLPLFIWTVDDEAQLVRALDDPRVACVITNRPLHARDLRERLATPPRAPSPG
jgi:glycerophosphoryl diester phosphodiesterase